MIDGIPVSEARAGQKVQVSVDLGENEYVSSIVIRNRKNIGYNAELISETPSQQVYQFTMIDDDARPELGFAADGAVYADENGEAYKIREVKKINSSTNLTLTTGWYIVSGNVTIDKRVEISGDVNLILPDDKTLTCNDGIHNGEGNSLTILGQEKGNGCLDVLDAGRNKAGIGGNSNQSGGTFILHSGCVDVKGGGEYGRGGDIRTYGGEVFGEGDYEDDFFDEFTAAEAGIGGGEDQDGGYIEINGGRVKGWGGKGISGDGAGIGGGSFSETGCIDICGGAISAHSNDSFAIGYENDNSQVHLGPNMIVYGVEFQQRYEAMFTRKFVSLYEAS